MTQLRTSAEWRLFSFNWVPIGLMVVALALGLAFADFSLNRRASCCRSAPLGFTPGPCLLQRIRAAQTRSGRRLCAGMHRADRAYHAVDDAVDLYFRRRRPADAGRELGSIGPDARPRLARLLLLHLRAPQADLDGCPRLRHDRLADLRHSRRARTDASFSPAAPVHACVHAGAGRDHCHLGVRAGDRHLRQARHRARSADFTPGAYLDQLRDLPLVRDGSLRELDMRKLGGIITFPSFHAAAAVLYLWALWSVWWMRPVALIAGGTMLVATPIGGGHFFVDVLSEWRWRCWRSWRRAGSVSA